MAARDQIAHKGRVVDITPTMISVEIISESACSACHASSLCGLSEYTRKCVRVPATLNDDFSLGEEVNVLLKASMGHKAVFFGYGLPLVVLVAGLGISLAAGAGELAAGLAGIAAVAAYYLVIWLLRNRLRTEYGFVIEKDNTD